MARYRHLDSGVTVSVADDVVLDSSWEPINDEPAKRAPAKKAAARKPAAKK